MSPEDTGNTVSLGRNLYVCLYESGCVGMWMYVGARGQPWLGVVVVPSLSWNSLDGLGGRPVNPRELAAFLLS